MNEFGGLLHEAWQNKKRLDPYISDIYINKLYDVGIKNGALGGKILGAGGGGFFLAFARDPGLKEKIKYDLYPNFIALDVHFRHKGTEILWKNF